MTASTSISAFLTSTRTAEWVSEDPVSALYVSAGEDTRALTFTHPAFLAAQGAPDAPAPNVFVFIDRSSPWDPDDLPMIFGDHASPTEVRTHRIDPLSVAGHEAYALDLEWRSTSLQDRRVRVLRIKAMNQDVARAVAAEGWVPDVFIGVCDGCAGFGLSDRCENDLGPWRQAAGRELPRWWITDHFKGTPLPQGADPQNGDVIPGPSADFPYVIRQRAFLSTLWRGPCSARAIKLHGGARLFEVVAKPPAARPGESLSH